MLPERLEFARLKDHNLLLLLREAEAQAESLPEDSVEVRAVAPKAVLEEHLQRI